MPLSFAGSMKLCAALLIYVALLAAASASAQTAGCVPNTANYPCVYVANETDGTVSVVNATTNTAVTTVTVGSFPEGVAITPNNASVYVANSGNPTVSVIDTSTNTVSTTVTMTNFPFQVAISPDGKYAWVVEFESDLNKRRGRNGARRFPQSTPLIEVIATASNTIVGSISNLVSPSAVAIGPDGTTAYAADTCGSGDSEYACVDVINTSTYTVTSNIALPSAAETFENASIAVSPDGTLVYVTDVELASEQTNTNVVDIELNNNTTVDYMLSTDTELSDYGVTVTPDGKFVYAAIPYNSGGGNLDDLYMVNPSQNTVSPIKVGNGPTGTALTPDGASVYVTNAADNTYSIVNTRSGNVNGPYTVGTDPQGVTAMRVNPVPMINEPLVPDATPAGGSEFTLTVNGTGFNPNCAIVNWNGTQLPMTTDVSPSQLTASVPAANIASAATASITVTNCGSGEGGPANTSIPVFFPVTNSTGSNISLARAFYTTGDYPFAVATGDFNHDGKLDLAVASDLDDNVGILLGNGDGTFQGQSVYSTGNQPAAVIIGDFNGDGNPDSQWLTLLTIQSRSYWERQTVPFNRKRRSARAPFQYR